MKQVLLLLSLVQSSQAIACFELSTVTNPSEVLQRQVVGSQQECEAPCRIDPECTGYMIQQDLGGKYWCVRLGKVKASMCNEQNVKVFKKVECATTIASTSVPETTMSPTTEMVRAAGGIQSLDPSGSIVFVYTNDTVTLKNEWTSTVSMQIIINPNCRLVLTHVNGSAVEYLPLWTGFKTFKAAGLAKASGQCGL